MIFDHYLALSTWNPDFIAETTKVERTLEWIHFPCLNIAFYDESAILTMMSTVGRPVRMDNTTFRADRSKFGCVCIEIDLTRPVIGRVWLQGHWYHVQYEGLHLLYAHCGHYGHLGRNCMKTPSPNQ